MVTLVSQNINEFELHLRAFLNLPIPNISLLKPSATRVIISDKESNTPSYSGLNEALELENTKVLIFGKPTAKKGRRMGVVLSTNDDLNIARENADKSALKIKIISPITGEILSEDDIGIKGVMTPPLILEDKIFVTDKNLNVFKFK